MDWPRVTVITLNWNGKEDTLQCVESLQQLNYPNYEIVVVDNGSEDDSVPALRERFPGLTLIETGENLGYARGFNTGLRYAADAGSEYFLILNNDTWIDADALIEMVKVAQDDAQVGFVSGKVYFYDQPDLLQTVGRSTHPIFVVGGLIGYREPDRGQYDEVTERAFVDDVFLLVRRAVFEEIGGYDPTFFLMYEETDWCARARRAGFKLMYTPHAKIWHKGNRDQLSGIGPTHQFYLARNQIPFVRRNASLEQFRRYLKTLLLSYLPRQSWQFLKRGQLRLLLAYWRGIGSGLLWLRS